MSPIEFYKMLSNFREDAEIISLSSPEFGRLRLKINQNDIRAARMLLPLFEAMPKGSSIEDVVSILDKAHWWVVFWQSIPEPPPKRAGNGKH